MVENHRSLSGVSISLVFIVARACVCVCLTAFFLSVFSVAPVCRPGQETVQGVGRGEAAKVACEVEANPADGVRYTWRFNNSRETVELERDRYTEEGPRSTAAYTPHTPLDYGTLMCWASNEYGKQSAPCVYQVIAAGKCAAPPPPLHLNRSFGVFTFTYINLLPLFVSTSPVRKLGSRYIVNRGIPPVSINYLLLPYRRDSCALQNTDKRILEIVHRFSFE